MKTKSILVVAMALLVLCALAPSALAECYLCIPPVGIWEDSGGSYLELKADGSVEGIIVVPVPGYCTLSFDI